MSNYLKYNRSGEVVEVIIREASGGKIESWKFTSGDKQKAKLVGKILLEKYGINFKPEIDRDLNWLKKDKHNL